MTTPTTTDRLAEVLKRLRAPAYWMSGSSDGHEGENDAPLQAADLIQSLSIDLGKAQNEIGNLTKHAAEGWGHAHHWQAECIKAEARVKELGADIGWLRLLVMRAQVNSGGLPGQWHVDACKALNPGKEACPKCNGERFIRHNGWPFGPDCPECADQPSKERA